MSKWLWAIGVIVVYGFICYQWGKSEAKIEIVTREVEVVKYELKEVCDILVKPNLNDDDISRLFDSNHL